MGEYCKILATTVMHGMVEIFLIICGRNCVKNSSGDNFLSHSCDRLPPCPGDLCPSRFECSAVRRSECQRLVQDHHNQLTEDEEDRQIQRHQVALMLLSCSMFLVSKFLKSVSLFFEIE